MKKELILGLVLLFIVACAKTNTTGQTVSTKSLNTNRAPVAKDDNVVVKTNDVTVTGNAGSGNWCDQGADWSWIAPGEGSAKWSVVGIESSGKYKGLCHIEYEVQSGEGSTRMDYYINEDEDSGYLEMTMPNGQKFTQEWTN